MVKFNSEAYAKCILAGEHSVLRGSSAIAAPIKSIALKSEWQLADQPLELDFSGEHGRELSIVFGGVLDQASKKLGIRREELSGQWKLSNQIQLGGGLGASAAICVSIARYLVSINKISESEVYEFSQSLEDLFHGESSGVDIVASMSSGPILFSRNGTCKKIDAMWNPIFCLSYSGHKGTTSECVNQVKKFIEKNPQRGTQLDQKMSEAVDMIARALELGENSGFNMLVDALNLSSSCFEEWGLIDMQMRQEMNMLKANGAVAVKPTGSGKGGYLLSLWREVPTHLQSLINLNI